MSAHCHPVQGDNHDEWRQYRDADQAKFLWQENGEGKKSGCGSAFTGRKRAISDTATVKGKNRCKQQVSPELAEMARSCPAKRVFQYMNRGTRSQSKKDANKQQLVRW